MEIKDAIQNEDVVRSLRSLEDKLYEIEYVVIATEDNDNSVYVDYKLMANTNMPYIHVAIETDNPPKKIKVGKITKITDYVLRKLSEVSEDWPSDVRLALKDIQKVIVTLNDEVIYEK